MSQKFLSKIINNSTDFTKQQIIDQIKWILRRLEDKAYIAGGACRLFLEDNCDVKTIGDLDIYCIEKDNFQLISDTLIKLNFIMQVATKNSTTWIHKTFPFILNLVRCVESPVSNKMFGPPEEVVSTFDLDVNACFMKINGYGDIEVFYTEEALENINNKVLTIQNVYEIAILSTLCRILKYVQKGYSIPPQQIKNLLSSLNPEKVEQLSEIWY